MKRRRDPTSADFWTMVDAIAKDLGVEVFDRRIAGGDVSFSMRHPGGATNWAVFDGGLMRLTRSNPAEVYGILESHVRDFVCMAVGRTPKGHA